MKKLTILTLILGLHILTLESSSLVAQQCTQTEYIQKAFIHPGVSQSKEDLDYVRKMVSQKKEPWINAFNILKKNIDINYKPQPYTYVSVGAYNVNNIGGDEFSKSASQAYENALLWYITKEKKYAQKSIEILNAWSYKLWGFDGNNAKLNVGLFGHKFLNAAEILRYSDSGWATKDIEQFERLTLTVFYPTIQDFFTEANGNWDGSMIATMLSIAIFTNNHDMFNKAVERFYRGEGNSGITKYVYPGGQCQEATRDWSHVQLGLGEFAKAAQIALTQGLDFYSLADDRLAQGFEYMSGFLLNEKVDCFGDISQRDKENKRDIYESIYLHYTNTCGIELPFTKQLITKYTRSNSSIEFLSATRKDYKDYGSDSAKPLISLAKTSPKTTGALNSATIKTPSNAVLLKPGMDIQIAIDSNPNTYIQLSKGIYTLKQPLKLKSGITLAGEGIETVLILEADVITPTIINTDNNMSDITIRDLLIDGATKTGTGFDPNYERTQRLYSNAPSREGIIFTTNAEGSMKNIVLKNITVQNFTKNGILISGAKNVQINNCNIENNGSSVVPGRYFHHNLKLTHSADCQIKNSRFVSSLWGNGIEISFCKNILVENNELSRNKLSGLYCTESENVNISSNLVEGNEVSGVYIENLMDGCKNILIQNNTLQYNARYGVETVGENEIVSENNKMISNKL